jgi:succinate-acetate transporter protein
MKERGRIEIFHQTLFFDSFGLFWTSLLWASILFPQKVMLHHSEGLHLL